MATEFKHWQQPDCHPFPHIGYQKHHSETKPQRMKEYAWVEKTDEDLLKQAAQILRMFGLPECTYAPPSGLPFRGSKLPDDFAVSSLVNGMKYLLAFIEGRHEAMWRAHDDMLNDLLVQKAVGRSEIETSSREAMIKSEAERNDRLSKQQVYFIKSAGGPIKIGAAINPNARLASLQTSHHERLTLMASCPGGQSVEREYHRRFADDRLHGEWFSPSPAILNEIERLTNG